MCFACKKKKIKNKTQTHTHTHIHKKKYENMIDSEETMASGSVTISYEEPPNWENGEYLFFIVKPGLTSYQIYIQPNLSSFQQLVMNSAGWFLFVVLVMLVGIATCRKYLTTNSFEFEGKLSLLFCVCVCVCFFLLFFLYFWLCFCFVLLPLFFDGFVFFFN